MSPRIILRFLYHILSVPRLFVIPLHTARGQSRKRAGGPETSNVREMTWGRHSIHFPKHSAMPGDLYRKNFGNKKLEQKRCTFFSFAPIIGYKFTGRLFFHLHLLLGIYSTLLSIDDYMYII